MKYLVLLVACFLFGCPLFESLEDVPLEQDSFEDTGVNNASCAEECSGTTPYCQQDACVQCRTDDDCNEGECQAGICTGCLTASDCVERDNADRSCEFPFGGCDYECSDGFVDRDGDISNGCECASSAEVCNGEDDDCDGETDEGLDDVLCSLQEGVCQDITASCEGGVEMCRFVEPYSPEDDEFWRCDGNDNDCDGETDEACCEDGELWIGPTLSNNDLVQPIILPSVDGNSFVYVARDDGQFVLQNIDPDGTVTGGKTGETFDSTFANGRTFGQNYVVLGFDGPTAINSRLNWFNSQFLPTQEDPLFPNGESVAMASNDDSLCVAVHYGDSIDFSCFNTLGQPILGPALIDDTIVGNELGIAMDNQRIMVLWQESGRVYWRKYDLAMRQWDGVFGANVDMKGNRVANLSVDIVGDSLYFVTTSTGNDRRVQLHRMNNMLNTVSLASSPIEQQPVIFVRGGALSMGYATMGGFVLESRTIDLTPNGATVTQPLLNPTNYRMAQIPRGVAIASMPENRVWFVSGNGSYICP